MHQDRIASWLLAQVTARERAASTVADIRQGSGPRSSFWFWRVVLGSAASMLWQGMALNPAHMLGLAIRGWLVGCLFLLVFLTAYWIFLLFGVALIAVVFGNSIGRVTAFLGVLSLGYFLSPFQWVGLVTGVLLCQFLAARWTARRAQGREVSACFALVILQLVTQGVVSGRALFADYGAFSVVVGLIFAATPLVCWAAALWVRRKAPG